MRFTMSPSRAPLVLLLTAACGGGGAPVAVAERDSAGVAIVENRMDTAAARTGWAIGAAPTLVIGGIDAPETQQVYRVRGGRRLADGRIVIADGGAAEVRVYGPDGSLRDAHGRKGEGPGEFQQPSVAGVLAGDSVIVYDSRLRRVSVVHADSGFVRSYQVGTEGGGFPVAIGITADGGLAVGGGMFFSSATGFPQGAVRPNSRYALLAPDGAMRGDLGEVPAAEMFAIARDNMFHASTLPFGRTTAAAAAAHRLWLGTGDTWEIRAYGLDGRLERIVRFERSLPPVTDALWQAHLEERLVDASDENEASTLRTRHAEMPAPDVIPPYERLDVDALGHVWIGEFAVPGEDERTYTIVDGEGRAVGRLTLPARTSPLDIGVDYLLGVTLDDLDVERLTLWELARPGR